jgi:AcrR family transcriptional regulator
VTRSGSASRPAQRATSTRQGLVDACVEILRTDGFAAATARSIAERAGCNQGLVFYHFGSVVNLLLAAMDQVSSERRERYENALSEVEGMRDLMNLAARVFSEDLDTGDAALLVEMIAGSSSTPGLGEEVRSRIEPWNEFASDAVSRALQGSPFESVVDSKEVAYAVVALYLGLELLSHLDGDRSRALGLFARVGQFAALADSMVQS